MTMSVPEPVREVLPRRGRRASFACPPDPVRVAALLLLTVAVGAAAASQPLAFGSSDDVLELGTSIRPEDRFRAAGYLGPAYLPDEWRAAGRLEVEALAARLSVGLGGTVHSGDSGLYGPEDDELYDVARLVRYVRLNSTTADRSYLRLGPTERVTLASGALARGYRTTAAWDERSIGLEGALEAGRLRLAGFADDVLRFDGVVGAEFEVDLGAAVGPVRGLGVTVAGVHDLGRSGITGDSSLTGLEVTARGTLPGIGPLDLEPYATHARYLGQGSTVGGGVRIGSDNVGDVFRGSVGVGVFASTPDFVPGHVGPFYSISNASERIVDDGGFFESPRRLELAGTPLDSLAAGLDLVLDLRLLAFGRFELSQHVRRHVGDETASAFALRAAGRLPGQGRIEFALERQDFRGFFDLIQDLGQLNTLVLDVQVPVGSRGVVFVRSRYGYRRLTDADGLGRDDRFLVERRFEPLVGVRLSR